MATITFKGKDELIAAIRRNPTKVKQETVNYLKRGTAELLREMKKPAWRVGASGGGAPEDTGNLRQAHRTEINTSSLYGRVYADSGAARYAVYVHEGTKRMKARPWLEYAKKQKEKAIMAMQDDLLKKIVQDLAK